MFGSKVKLEKDLYDKCKKYIQDAGYSSVDEFVTNVVEKEIQNWEQETTKGEKKVEDRLKGLGYIE